MDFTGFPPDDALNGWTVIGHRATPTPWVGASAGRIGAIPMGIPFLTCILEHLIPFGDRID